MPAFSTGVVCPPAQTFANGLTTACIGEPDLRKAQEQHSRYCEALREAGLDIIELAADPRYPDSTFIEDTALVGENWAILTRPGAPSRLGEIERMEKLLSDRFSTFDRIVAPGTLDGGDVCEIGDHVLIGMSARTNEDGCVQLSRILASKGLSSEIVDIREMNEILHLKSGIAHLGGDDAIVINSLRGKISMNNVRLHIIPPGEEYAANCIRVNEKLLIAAGFPSTAGLMKSLNLQIVELEMSEFRKMDGGLSCLSLRF